MPTSPDRLPLVQVARFALHGCPRALTVELTAEALQLDPLEVEELLEEADALLRQAPDDAFDQLREAASDDALRSRMIDALAYLVVRNPAAEEGDLEPLLDELELDEPELDAHLERAERGLAPAPLTPPHV